MKAAMIIKKIGCSQPFFNRVIRGEKGFGYKNAKKASQIMGGGVGVWMDDTRAAERKVKYYKKRGIPFNEKEDS